MMSALHYIASVSWSIFYFHKSAWVSGLHKFTCYSKLHFLELSFSLNLLTFSFASTSCFANIGLQTPVQFIILSGLGFFRLSHIFQHLLSFSIHNSRHAIHQCLLLQKNMMILLANSFACIICCFFFVAWMCSWFLDTTWNRYWLLWSAFNWQSTVHYVLWWCCTNNNSVHTRINLYVCFVFLFGDHYLLQAK